MTAGPELVVTGEELTLLWEVSGAPFFGYSSPSELDEASELAVARGLIARGFLDDDDGEPSMAADVARLLEPVLFSDRMLRSTSSRYDDAAAESVQEVVWRRGDALVRHTPSARGLHRFCGCDRSAAEALLADVLAFLAAADSQQGTPVTLPGSEYDDALQVVSSDGAAAAAARHPALEGYVEALEDCRAGTVVEVCDAELEGEELSFTESPRHGLWLVRGGDGGAVVVQRISVDGARDQVATLLRAFG